MTSSRYVSVADVSKGVTVEEPAELTSRFLFAKPLAFLGIIEHTVDTTMAPRFVRHHPSTGVTQRSLGDPLVAGAGADACQT